jgi:multidrug efflux pump
MTQLRKAVLTGCLLGAVPLAMSFGNGGEIWRPLGLAIVGGPIVSQLMTLYATPVLYLFMEGLAHWSRPSGTALAWSSALRPGIRAYV